MQNPGNASRADVSREELTSQAAEVLARLRAKSPRVHCITNAVAQNFTANALLALGAVPSMTLSAEEIGSFVASSDALLVNLGTFDRERREATSLAVDAASQNGLPWVLDPVFVDRAAQRAVYARDLIFLEPKAVRLNAAEFAALSVSEPARDAVISYARERRIVIGLSGATDLITDGERVASIANGHPLMARVTAMGCAASSLVAACLAVEPDALMATASAMLIVGVAGEMAAANAQERGSFGPGSFAAAILDALYLIDAQMLAAKARTNQHG